MQKIDLNKIPEYKLELTENPETIKNSIEMHFDVELEGHIPTMTFGSETSLVDSIYFHTEDEIDLALDELTKDEKAALMNAVETDDTIAKLQGKFVDSLFSGLEIEKEDLGKTRTWFWATLDKADEILRSHKKAEETKHFCYTPESVEDLMEALANLEEYESKLNNTHLANILEIKKQWDKGTKLAINATVSEGDVGFDLGWGGGFGKKMTKKQLRMLAHQDAYKTAFDEFSYKFELIGDHDEYKAVKAAERIGFELAKDTREEGGRDYFNISVDKVYEGEKKTYGMSSDEFLFWRNDEYISTDFEHFLDIVWVIDTVGRKDKLKPIDMSIGA